MQPKTLQYHDNFAKWVLGQPKTLTVNGITVGEATFDTVTAQQLTYRAFGQLMQTLTYRTDGTVATVKDGRNYITQLNSWKRGIPQQVLYPDTTSQSAVVDNKGWLSSVTNENGDTTTYTYDAMGRMESITPPPGTGITFNPTTITFAPVAATEYGIGAGHWKQTISRGNYRKVSYVDALWRPVIDHEYDTVDITGTQRFNGFKYDHAGRTTFAGFPRATASSIASFTTGTTTTYDALGRPMSVSASSEHGDLATTYEYLTTFKTRVTNPKLISTVTAYQAFDTPSTEAPTSIIAAEGKSEQITTTIARDDFGKALSVARDGTYASSPVSLTRNYVYDAQQRLCKRIDPEANQTNFAYDAAGNVAYTAMTSSLTDLQCDPISTGSSARVDFTYDARNRVTKKNFVDAAMSDIDTDYYDDGAVAAITMGPAMLSYEYNELGKLTKETLAYDTRNWVTEHAYTTNGDLASTTYPDGLVVPFVPNALGQATQAGTFATVASYFPNGALKQFTYGNGLVHTLTQNVRGLPERSKDALSTNVVLDDTYDFDFNGNVAGITDGLAGQSGNRDMSYDALDRLVGVVAGSAQGGNATFAYDPLDNLRIADQGARQYRYEYNATNNRLSTIKTPAGATVFTFTYDGRGNQATRTGATFTWDRAERLTATSLGSSSYVYDGLGRRVRATAGGNTIDSYYGKEGKLLHQESATTKTDYVHLAGSLVAERSTPLTGTPATVKYQHTDALGTPIVETDVARVEITGSRERMTAYGEPADGTYANGPGFTGHETDSLSKLSYMQQRYYDPAIGRLISVDPVEANTSTAWNFNRYVYAAGNPFKFVDPDGRKVAFLAIDPNSDFPGVAESQWAGAKSKAPASVRARMEQLEHSKYTHEIRPLSEGKYRQAYNEAKNPENESNGVGTGTTTYYDPNHSYRSGGKLVTPVDTLMHEGPGHAADKDAGAMPSRTEKDPKTGNTASEQSAMDVQNDYRRSNGQDEIDQH